MYTKVKTLAEIEAMRESGRMLALVLAKLREIIEPGQTTKYLDEVATKELRALGGEPAFLGYQGYPAVICISVNDEVVHGIPSAQRMLRDGDIVGLDFGVKYNGMITDSAISVIVGKPQSREHEILLQKTEESLRAGIKQVKAGVRIGDIAAAVQSVLEPAGYGIVRDLVGHGVGHLVHEDPNIPNYGNKGTGDRLQAGMTIAIEPMATLGGYGVTIDRDGWTIRTADHSLAAHFEHTILVTETGSEVLTKV